METTSQSIKVMLAKNLKGSRKFGDNLIEGAICLDVLEDPKIKDLAYEYHGKLYLNIKIVKRKEPNDFGKTHYIEIDTFVPKSKSEEVQPA